jgi:hypothetical protein
MLVEAWPDSNTEMRAAIWRIPIAKKDCIGSFQTSGGRHKEGSRR